MCAIDASMILAVQREIRRRGWSWRARKSLVLRVEWTKLLEILREMVMVLERFVYLLCGIKGHRSALSFQARRRTASSNNMEQSRGKRQRRVDNEHVEIDYGYWDGTHQRLPNWNEKVSAE